MRWCSIITFISGTSITDNTTVNNCNASGIGRAVGKRLVVWWAPDNGVQREARLSRSYTPVLPGLTVVGEMGSPLSQWERTGLGACAGGV